MEVLSARTCKIILLHTHYPCDAPAARKAKMSEQEWKCYSAYWEAASKEMENICRIGELEEMKKMTVSYTGRAPIEHPAALHVSIVDIRSVMPPLHCLVGAPKPSVRFPTIHKIKFFTAAEFHRATRNFITRILQGGSGKVYKGMLHHGNEPVAVKKYINEDSREVFVEEVRIHSKFSHTLMSVMEYMRKGNLNDRLHYSEIPIPLDVRLGTAIGCAEALSYMHSTHLSSGNLVCHSDIKPANILLDDNLTANFAEFGVSRLLAGGITRYTKTVKGNIEYMDPICIQEGWITPRYDVYSLGVVICDMDPIYTQEGCPTRIEIARDMASALVFLLDENVEPKISDFGLSRVHHADNHTHIPMGRAVHTHNGRESSPNFQSTKEQDFDFETSIGSHVSRRPRYLRVQHHPLMQILTSIPSRWRPLGFEIDPIADVDLYKFEPWDLPAAGKAKMGENEWCFFSPQDRKYPTTVVRANRATASGYWKATGTDKENVCSNRELEEMKKTPISYMDRAPIEHPAGVHVSIANMRSDALHNIEIKHEADIIGNIKIFTEVEIQRITRNFSTLIGKGDSGEVYRGFLDDDNEPVAVKKYINEDLEEFMEGVRILSKISHKNVVKLLGYCIVEHTLMSVWEYMPNGTLSDRLHHSVPIPWNVRLSILARYAKALSYMHSRHFSSGNLVCHSDIKPANILLDANLTANTAEFGVSRRLAGGITRYTKTEKGSIAYIDPIFLQEGELTPRIDVYSFGLVLLKLLTGKRVRKGDMDPIYTQEGCPTRMKIAQDMASALVFLLDEKVEPKISDFGLSRVHHADDHTHIPMGRAVHTHNGWLDAKVSGKPSAKRGVETCIGSHVSRRPRYLSVHHHPFMQILPSARNWIASKRTFMNIFKAWISAKLTYETPNTNAGPVSEYIIRELFGIWNELTVNESQQHSESDSCRSDHGKMAGNTKTSASWIIATAAPHHATGNRSLLSGFVTEHDDQFVHAANRVPMKVLARGAVVTNTLILPDVWFVPGLKENLVSVSQLAELDHSIGFGRGECCIRSARDAKIVGKGRLQKGGQYVLDYLKVPLAI